MKERLKKHFAAINIKQIQSCRLMRSEIPHCAHEQGSLAVMCFSPSFCIPFGFLKHAWQTSNATLYLFLLLKCGVEDKIIQLHHHRVMTIECHKRSKHSGWTEADVVEVTLRIFTQSCSKGHSLQTPCNQSKTGGFLQCCRALVTTGGGARKCCLCHLGIVPQGIQSTAGTMDPGWLLRSRPTSPGGRICDWL